MTPLERALSEIRKRPSVRTPVLGALLQMDDAEVDALLDSARDDGLLISCDVQVGDKRVREYRCSASGAVQKQFRVYQPPKAAAGQASAEPDKSPSAQERSDAPTPAAAPQEQPMTIREKIEKCLQEHGPLDSRGLRKKGLKEAALAQHLGDLADRKVLVRLGGGPRSTIYGLPDQKLADKTPAPPKAAKSAPPQERKAPKKATAAKKAKKAARKLYPAKGRDRAPLSPSRNGGGGAVTPAAGPATNGATHFAINHHGELGITKEETKLSLTGPEFAELREFISRTQPVWKGSSA